MYGIIKYAEQYELNRVKENSIQFVEVIEELRKQKELSQEKFALKIEMDRTYYASVEAGKRNISVRNIKKIADGLGVSMSQLFEGI